MKYKSAYLLGAGGHAKVILSTLLKLGYSCQGVYDDDPGLWGKNLWNIPIKGPIFELKDISSNSAIVSIGDNKVRKTITENFKNISWVTLVHPNSYIHDTVQLGEGTVIFAGTVIQPDSVIGNHTIINTSASIDHDCVIGNYVHIAPGCHIAGGVSIGDNVFMGISSSVIPYKTVAPNVTIGAGGCVVSDIKRQGTYVGVPAKMLCTLPNYDS